MPTSAGWSCGDGRQRLRLDVRPAAPGLGHAPSRGGPRRRDPRPGARPVRGDDRPPRRGASRPRHRVVWAGHAARLPRRTGHATLDVDARRADGRDPPHDHRVAPDDRQFHLHNGRISLVLRVYEDRLLGHLHLGAAARAGRTGTWDPDPFEGFANRVGDPIPFAYPTSGLGDYRVPALVARRRRRLDRRRPPLPRHAIAAGKPDLDGLPATYVEATTEADTLDVILGDDSPASRSTSPSRCSRPAGPRPQRDDPRRRTALTSPDRR